MSKLKVVRNIKGTKSSNDNNNIKEVFFTFNFLFIQINVFGKLQADKAEQNLENTKLIPETSNYKKANLSLKKLQIIPRAPSGGKLKTNGTICNFYFILRIIVHFPCRK